MTKLLAALACAFASTAVAQVGTYLGPGIMSDGAGTIGNRSGAAVNFRFYGDVDGVYDNGLQPFQINSKGELVTLNGLYGEQINGGVYGTHIWHDATLGLDVTGFLYHYDNASSYDGSNVNLMLGYTWQKSRHLIFDLREGAGTSSLGYGLGSQYYEPTSLLVSQPTSLLFDNRLYYIQSSADVTYVQSARTSYTLGGSGFFVRRQAAGLAGVDGYTATGTVRHRLSKDETIGFTYQHYFMDFPPSFGQSSTDMGEAFFATSLGRRWTFRLMGGAFHTEISGIQQISINPVVAALLGTSVGFQAFYRTDIYPSGDINLTAHLRNSYLGLDYLETVVPGNGIYLTSRQESGTATYSYTGIHKLNVGISGGYYKLDAIGLGIQPYASYSGGAGFTYGLTRAFHIVGRYDARHQEITFTNGFRSSSYRVSLGVAFSPGNVPLSLW